MTETTTDKIFKSRNHLLDILDECGYKTDEYSNLSYKEVYVLETTNQLNMLIKKKDGSDTDSILIWYYLKQLKKRELADIIENAYDPEMGYLKETDTLYIVVPDETPSLIPELINIYESKHYHVIVQSIKRLQFNILKHSYVPKHQKISQEELNILLTRLNSTVDKLPKLSRFDPVAQAIILKPGEVCRITRPSLTSIETEYYRLCLNASTQK